MNKCIAFQLLNQLNVISQEKTCDIIVSGDRMNFKNMNYYLTVCASDTITSAAKFLSVSQQALSQTIKSIEQELNVKLFERTNPIILTSEGLVVKNTFENILNEYALLSSSFKSKNTITIGYFEIPDMDMISFGPNLMDIHSPEERLSISSCERTWNFLLEVIKSFK